MNIIGPLAFFASSRTDVTQDDGRAGPAGTKAWEKSLLDGVEVIEEAAKSDVPAGGGGKDDTGSADMAEGVINWREEVLAFFINIVSSSLNLRLLPSRSTPGGDIATKFGARGRLNGLLWLWLDREN